MSKIITGGVGGEYFPKHCAICKSENYLYPLELEDDGGEKYTKYVCGKCWDVISGIVLKVLEAKELLLKQ